MPKSVLQLDPEQLTLRPINEADLPFLLNLYGSTREQELAQIAWSDEQKQQFITMQFEAQHHHYQEHYPDASFDVILYQGEAIGRFYLEEWESEFRVIDIALLPEHCGQGIGSWFLRGILDKAAAVGKRVSIHVEQNNPALRLYQRLGFNKVNERGIYYLMVWQPVSLCKGEKNNDADIPARFRA